MQYSENNLTRELTNYYKELLSLTNTAIILLILTAIIITTIELLLLYKLIKLQRIK